MKLPSLRDVLDLLDDPKSDWYADPAIGQHTPEYLAYFEAVRIWAVYEAMALHWDSEHAQRKLTDQETGAYKNVAELTDQAARRARVLHWPVLNQMARVGQWKGF
jgi:hypothetical protein